MTAQIAESVVGHGRDPGVQPRARVPRGVRRGERREPADEHVRAVAQLALLPGDRGLRHRRDRVGAARRRPPARPGHALGRHAHLRRLPAQPRLPASPGAVGPLRPGAVGGRRDGEDLVGPRHRAPRSRTRRTRAGSSASRDGSTWTRSGSRTARSRSSAASTCTSPPARASRSSGTPATGSRRSRSSSAASTTPTTARSASTASTCARSSSARTGGSSASSSRTRSSSRGRSPTTSASRVPARPTRRCARRRRAIGIDRVAARFDDGLGHLVREGGAGLSAGERQLISIARALLADPRILILDEATSNIDRPTEILIEQRARPAPARPHVDHHRAPPRDGPPRGRDPRRRARPDRPARHRARAARRGRPVPPPRARPARAGHRVRACKKSVAPERPVEDSQGSSRRR